MSERKVLNKYYPPDYDPAKIPKLKLAKDRQYVIRVMAPFHMRCKTCGNYIYKGTKFNSRKETVQDDDYIGLRIFRFYIKCTKCVAEITFKTDPENQDYAIEHGATRNFEAEKLLQEQEKQEREQEEEDESNPMKVLEKRTKDSKREMELLENLEELRDLNQRQANINYDNMLGKYCETEEDRIKREKEEDEKAIKEIFNSSTIRRLKDGGEDKPNKKLKTTHENSSEVSNPSGLLSDKSLPTNLKKDDSKSNKLKLLGIVKKSSDKKEQELKNISQKSEPTTTLGLLCDYGSSSSSDDND